MNNKPLHILLINNHTFPHELPETVTGLANAMHERGHKVTIISQRPVPAILQPIYRLGCKIRDLSLPEGQTPPAPRGSKKLGQMYPLAKGIEIWPYNFTDRNLTIQKLRAKIRAANFDVCLAMLGDKSHLVWAVTMLGSGVPYIYSEFGSPEFMENVAWTRQGRLSAMSGADAIHFVEQGYIASLPNFMQERAVVIPRLATGNEQIVYDAWEELLQKTAAKKGATEMDSFYEEPFASLARLYAMSKREWLWRDFGQPVPGSLEDWVQKNLWKKPRTWVKQTLQRSHG